MFKFLRLKWVSASVAFVIATLLAFIKFQSMRKSALEKDIEIEKKNTAAAIQALDESIKVKDNVAKSNEIREANDTSDPGSVAERLRNKYQRD